MDALLVLKTSAPFRGTRVRFPHPPFPMLEEETGKDLNQIVMDAAEEQNLDVEVMQYRDEQHMADIFRIHSEIEYLDGTTDTYRADISITDDMILDPDADEEEIFMMKADRQLRNIKEESAKRMEVNGHTLIFYLQNGFHGWSQEAGREFTVEPEEYEHTQTPLPTLPEDRDSVPEWDARVFDEPPEIPMHIKERLMMYVVGWALEYSPDEWLDREMWTNRMEEEDAFDRKI